jgi:hypothetical protein
VHLVAEHARHVETQSRPGFVEHGVVAGAARTEAEVVAHQHVARTHAPHQHVADEGLRRHGGERVVKACHHHVLDAAALEFGQLVAQRGNARRRGVGLAQAAREVVARVRLESQHAGRQAAVARFVRQQRQHRLVAAVHAVEVADGQRTARHAQIKPAVDAHGVRLSRWQAEQATVQGQVGRARAVPVELRGVGTDGLGAAGLQVT